MKVYMRAVSLAHHSTLNIAVLSSTLAHSYDSSLVDVIKCYIHKCFDLVYKVLLTNKQTKHQVGSHVHKINNRT